MAQATAEKKQVPYGLWNSQVTSRLVSQRLRLEEACWNADGDTLVWLERRSGRGVLVAKTGSETPRDLSDEPQVRGMVGYGGGEVVCAGDWLVYSGSDGRLYRQGLNNGHAFAITPPFGAAAAPAISPDRCRVLFVFSDGQTDLLALADANGIEWPVQIVRGADFYMQPAWHPGGEWIAWVEWDFPNMPWDGTRVVLGRTAGSPRQVVDTIVLAGDSDIPAVQPTFSPDGRWLSYICSNGDWDDLVLYNLESGERRVLIHGDGFHLSEPAWVQGMRSHGWNHKSTHVYSLRNFSGRAELWRLNVMDGTGEKIPTAPYTWLRQISVSPVREQAAFLASSTQVPERLVRWDGHQIQVDARSGSEQLSEGYLPQVQPVSWLAADGTRVHGNYYPPANPDITSSGAPPVLIYIHGGPTSAAVMEFNAERIFFTSRGYAWLDLNYRGSTGYGHAYERSLREGWGQVDVEDAAGAVHALVQQGLGNPRRLVIRGGSSGGYTVYNALIHYPELIKAGISLYGISDLFADAAETHKFERCYNDRLVGKLPGASDRYHEWSPLFHVERIHAPLAIFQGQEDQVVPPAQSEKIVRALQQNGVPVVYYLYEGEGHGFRRAETIRDYLFQTEQFLRQYVLLAP